MKIIGLVIKLSAKDAIMNTIRDSIPITAKPCVFLSGGLDSTILVHHLNEVSSNITTLTAYWDAESDENEAAFDVSDVYGTNHYEICINDILNTYEKLIPFLDSPHRINLWVYYLYDFAKTLELKNVYIGEGFDEHFGGYWYKDKKTYQEYWSGLIEYSIPTHRLMAVLTNRTLHIPFLTLDVRKTLPYYDYVSRNKEILRDVYKNELPEFVIKKKKQAGRTPYLEIWEREFSKLHKEIPIDRDEAQYLMRRWVAKTWLK